MLKKAIFWAVLLLQISLFSVATVSADSFPIPGCAPWDCPAQNSV
jgi:hypothetical protein